MAAAFSTATLAALLAAAAMAGALAAVIVITGGEDPPAAGPADGIAAGGEGRGDSGAPPAGIGAAPSSGAAQGGGSTGTVDFAQRQQPQEPEPGPAQPGPPAVRAGDVRAAAPPAGSAAPPGAQTFYTKAALMEFVEAGGAHSPVASLAARYPVGGNVLHIMTGGLPEPGGTSPGARQLDEWMAWDGPGMATDAPIAEGDAAVPDAGMTREGSAAGTADDASPASPAAAGPPLAAEGGGGGGGGGFAAAPAMSDSSSQAAAPAPPPSPEHSTTNIQVEGVDEPDFVKNDARHIYILDGGELTVIDALPADTVQVLSGGSAGEVRDSYRPEDASIVFRGPVGPPPGEYRYDNMFLDGDSLVVVYEARQWASVPIDPADPSRTVAVELPSTYVMWVDVGDRSAPVPAGEYAVDGEYRTARMIDGTVYLVTRTGLGERGGPPGLPGLRYSDLEGGQPGVPCIGPGGDDAAAAAGTAGASPQSPASPECASAPLVPPAHYIVPVDEDPSLTTVSALPRGGSSPAAQTYLLGGDDIVYASASAVYLALPREVPGAAEVLDGLRDTGLLRDMVEPLGAQWRQEAVSAAVRAGVPPAERLEAVLSAVQSGYAELEPGKRAAALRALDDAAWSWHYAAVPAEPRTDVHRIEIGGAAPGGGPALSHAGAGTVSGEPLDQFSMDEHGGMLRIATAVWGGGAGPAHTAVHVIDAGSMAVKASLEGIAPGETMESARFAGDTLFLVTFLQVDPFFVVDMSGMVPVILGELKIPGFSTYLQPYGQDAVVGVGTYVSENVNEPGRDWSVKVSLYDVSDYRRPLLADEAVIEGSAWSPAQSSHRALLADAERGIVALPVVFDWGGPRPGAADAGIGVSPDEAGGWTGFYAFRTDAAAKSLGGAHAIRHGAAADGAPPEGRSLYIADWLYTIYDGMLAVSSMDDPGRLVTSIDLGR